jgi:hypothetical protein
MMERFTNLMPIAITHFRKLDGTEVIRDGMPIHYVSSSVSGI